jgi:transposase
MRQMGGKRATIGATLVAAPSGVNRSDHIKGFAVLPKRWIVERTTAWLNRCRRLAKDWENLNRNALAFLRLASLRLNAPKTLQSRLMFPDRL